MSTKLSTTCRGTAPMAPTAIGSTTTSLTGTPVYAARGCLSQSYLFTLASQLCSILPSYGTTQSTMRTLPINSERYTASGFVCSDWLGLPHTMCCGIGRSSNKHAHDAHCAIMSFTGWKHFLCLLWTSGFLCPYFRGFNQSSHRRPPCESILHHPSDTADIVQI